MEEGSAGRHHSNTSNGPSSRDSSVGKASVHNGNLFAAPLNPTLCSLCQTLSVKKLLTRQEACNDVGYITEEYGCLHHKNFSALKASAQTCALCKLFVLTIGQDNGRSFGNTIKAPHLTDEELASSRTEIRLLGLEFPVDQSVPPALSHLSVGHSSRSEVLALYSEVGKYFLALEDFCLVLTFNR